MKIVILLSAIILLSNYVFAEEFQPVANPSQAAYQNVPYSECTKIFNLDKEKLFYLTLGAINANKYTTDEIQTANGYIMFTVARNKYLATVAEIDNANSILKIAPCNNLYYFPTGILNNIYKFIESNNETELK